jgi:hypothetical protein
MSMSTRRNRHKNAVSFEARLQKAAHEAREAAQELPEGEARDTLLKRAREAETAVHLTEWLTSPGQPSPK